jgi:hypothetical protein
MKAGLGGNATKDDISKFLTSCATAAKDLVVDYWLDTMTDLQAANVIRAIVLERVGAINETLRVALSRGYLLPDSPFPKIEQINSHRQLFQPIDLPFNDQIYLFNAAVELSKIAKEYKDGQITFDRQPAAQLASYEISVDGISPQSGDALMDILGYQPDGDYVKRKRAIDSLSKLDFSKRKPYLLFTIESKTGGIMVCWSKMRDATGYVISRRDVFNNEELPDIVMTNAGLAESTKDLLLDERFYQALSFYDWTTSEDVLAMSDESIGRDTLYSYEISGLQKKAPVSPFIFDVPLNALLFSQALVETARAALNEEAARFKKNPATMSPYPAMSYAIYGDPGFGWILAGCNVLASVRRGDSVDNVRANSYIGSTVEHIFAEATAGRFFIPSDLTKIQASVESAVSSYGVSQTILSVLDGTGVTNFVSGKDDPNGIQATQASVEGSTSGLARILSVIDPQTATLDPKLIITVAQPRAIKSTATQVRRTADAPVVDEITEEGTIDLTTYSGIGRFMQLLRTVYDFYPGSFV